MDVNTSMVWPDAMGRIPNKVANYLVCWTSNLIQKLESDTCKVMTIEIVIDLLMFIYIFCIPINHKYRRIDYVVELCSTCDIYWQALEVYQRQTDCIQNSNTASINRICSTVRCSVQSLGLPDISMKWIVCLQLNRYIEIFRHKLTKICFHTLKTKKGSTICIV